MFWNVILIFLGASIFGWILEVIYRSFVVQKKLVNPGFLNGPYLPLYGNVAIILFFISSLSINLYLKLSILILTPTILELLTGVFFLNFYHIKLWNYTDRALNYKGIICPIFSFYWALISLFFYYFIFPFLQLITLKPKPAYLFFTIGIITGLIFVDIWNSFGLALKIKEFIKEFNQKHQTKSWLDYKILKSDITQQFKNRQNKLKNYLLPLQSINKEKITEFLKKHTK